MRSSWADILAGGVALCALIALITGVYAWAKWLNERDNGDE